MSELLASFRELDGMSPATEARLHAAGVYTWEALAEVLDALGDVKDRELFDQISARVSEAGGDCVPRPPNGQRSEAFIVRLTLADDGQPVHRTVTNVRTQTVTNVRTPTQRSWDGPSPDGVIDFIEEQSTVPVGPVRERPVQHTRPPPAAGAAPGSRHHVVVLDAGKAIGGARRVSTWWCPPTSWPVSMSSRTARRSGAVATATPARTGPPWRSTSDSVTHPTGCR